MPVDALKVNDPRVEHKYCDVGGGLTYHYMLAKPEGTPVATVVLCHGWPDLGMGWRYQVPYLLSLNLQVVVPDMLGYGLTSAPDSYEEYTFRKMSAHLATLIKSVTPDQIILGGHDWGAYFAWRFCVYYPEMVSAAFSFCVPFFQPSPVAIQLEEMVKRAPNFLYQVQLASGVAEEAVGRSRRHLQGFLDGMYGGRGPNGEVAFSTADGVAVDLIDKIGPSPMVDREMMEFYVNEYSRNGLHAPCNWYRTRTVISEEELALVEKYGPGGIRLKMPAMLVMAGKDGALPPVLAEGQPQYFEAGLKMETVPEASHWILVQCPKESNQFIGEFLQGVLGDKLKASL